MPVEASPPTTGQGDSRDDLVLVLAPTGRDGPLTCGLLEERARVRCEPTVNVHDLCEKIERGAGVVVVAEEAIDVSGAHRLSDSLSTQLPWSDLPVLVLTSGLGEARAGVITALRQRGNVTVLDRPVRIVTLVSAVQSALRARRRQYEVRDLLAVTRNAIRQRDQFLAMLGHELRNPLATVTNAMSVIDATRAPANPCEAEQRDMIRRQNEHLARLVDDLLDVSRITSGKISLQRRPTDLGELAARAARSIALSAGAHEHTLVVNVPPAGARPVVVHADPVRLEQVINNLLTNAIKYTPQGGRIELAVTADAHDRAVLRVCDNGIGISRELLPCVFDLFTQAEPALDRSQGGLGIGLTLVRALVEMHDGRVSVKSTGAGCGSEFIITLPRDHTGLTGQDATSTDAARQVHVQDQPALQPRPMAVKSIAPQRRILVIEDQADARRVLQRLLQIWGHDVEVAEDGVRGLELVSRRPPDVALIDVGLPGLDGYEVARRIRAEFGDRIHLVALTGYGQPEDRARAYDAGFDLHLIKPVDRDQLTDALTPASHRERRRSSAAVDDNAEEAANPQTGSLQ